MFKFLCQKITGRFRSDARPHNHSPADVSKAHSHECDHDEALTSPSSQTDDIESLVAQMLGNGRYGLLLRSKLHRT